MEKEGSRGSRGHRIRSSMIPEARKIFLRSISFQWAMLILICLCWPSSTQAQWGSIGPDGGYIVCLAIAQQDPQTVYAGTNRGIIFKSTNAGVNWHQANLGMTNHFVSSLAIDSQNTQTVYAGTNAGVFKSIDGGSSWNLFNSGLTNFYVLSLAIDPQNTQTIYVGITGGVFKSIDGGANWNQTSLGRGTTYGVSLVIDPQDTQTIYAATSNGVYKSTDGGSTWSGLTNISVYCLAIDPQNTETIYAGGFNAIGVYKSTNGGLTWSEVNSGLSYKFISTLAIDPQNTQTIYAGTELDQIHGGIFKSTNGGANWSRIGSGPANRNIECLAVDPQNTQTIYAGTSLEQLQGINVGGVFKSANGGTTWNEANTALSGTPVFFVAVDPVDTQTIYAGASYGVYKSTNRGATWSQVSSGLPGLSEIGFIAVDSQNSQNIYALTYHVYKSTNGGGSWSAIGSGLEDYTVHCLAIDPQDPQTVYAGTQYSSYYDFPGGVFMSTNGGTSWSHVGSGLANTTIHCLAIDPQDTQTIYAGDSNGGIYKSANGGATWDKVYSGLTDKYVSKLAVDPENTQTIYAVTGSGHAYKSTNGGADWSQIDYGVTGYITSLAIDPANTQTIYAGTKWDGATGMGGVFRSVNGGTSWGRISPALANTPLYSLAVDPDHTETIYFGTLGGGVFKTSNGGDVPTPPDAPTGLTATAISASQIILNWLDLSENETGFKIERKTGTCASTSAWAEIAAIGPNATTFTNTKLAANKTFSYRIRACNGAGNSDYSACVSAKTALAGTPAAPTGLTATAASAGKISLKWTDKSKNETGFQIYRQKDSEPWTLLATTTVNLKKYDDTSAFGNDETASYGYYVIACNGGGCSPPTNTAIVPFKPTAIRAVSSAGKINLKWTDKSDNETGFQVYRKAGSCKSTGSWELIATTGANVHAHSDPDIPPETPYSYKVRAFIRSAALPYATGYSLYSGCATTTASKGAYSLADLAGTWRLNGLGSRFDTQFWRRGDLSVDKSGGFSISQTCSDGSLKNDTGTLSIGDDGMVASDGLPTMSACMEAGKSILGFSDTWPDGSIEMGILTKNANGYSSADLTGTWRGYGFASYHEAPWWDEVTATIH